MECALGKLATHSVFTSMLRPAALKGKKLQFRLELGYLYYSATHRPAQTHTAHIYTRIQMRSVAEGFKLSSVLSSAEVKPDCSNKGGLN